MNKTQKETNNAQYIIAKWHCDWADEFDTEGFIVTTKEKWDLYVSSLTSDDYVRSMYFGTNEGWDDLTVERYLENIVIQSLSLDEANILIKLFGKKGIWGWNGKKHTGEGLRVIYGIFPEANHDDYAKRPDLSDVLWLENK